MGSLKQKCSDIACRAKKRKREEEENAKTDEISSGQTPAADDDDGFSSSNYKERAKKAKYFDDEDLDRALALLQARKMAKASQSHHTNQHDDEGLFANIRNSIG